MDHRSLNRQAKADHTARIKERRGESPSDAAADKARVIKAFSEHDAQLHGGKKTVLHLRDGGCAEGSPAAARLDRPGRARGGKSMGKKGHTNVNVIVASGGGKEKEPVPVPVPAAGPPHPPMMPPPGAGGPMGPGGPPMGGPGMPPPGMGGPPPGMGMRPPMPGMPMRADGGKTVAFKMKAGASGGEGRLEKSKMPIPDENADD